MELNARSRELIAKILADGITSTHAHQLAKELSDLDKQVGPLPEPQIGHKYMEWTLIGIIEGWTRQNGQATYYATFRTDRALGQQGRVQYCTWYMGQQPKYMPEVVETDKDNQDACFCDKSPTGDAHYHTDTIPYSLREWEWIYDQGHYDFFGEDARKFAYRDMLVRSGMLPAPTEEQDIRPDKGHYTLSQPDASVSITLDIHDHGAYKLALRDNEGDTLPDEDKLPDQDIYLVRHEADHLRRVLNGKVKPDKPTD
jgi:hypothetical protein